MIEKKRPDRIETERRILEAYEVGLLQAKIDAVRFNTDLIVSRDGKLTRIPPADLIPLSKQRVSKSSSSGPSKRVS